MKSLHLTLSSKTHKWLLLPFIFLTLFPLYAFGDEVTITETFENQTASTTYNTNIDYDSGDSNVGIAWNVEHGTVSTGTPLNGTKSMQMRAYYAKNSNANSWNGSLPCLTSTTAVTGLKSINFKGKVGNTNLKISIKYSTNGSTWSYMKTTANADAQDQTYTTSSATYTYNIPSPSTTTDYYIRIEVTSNSTHTANPSKAGNIEFRVDDVAFTYDAGDSGDCTPISPSLSYTSNSLTVGEGDSSNPTLSGNTGNGTVTYSSSNTSVATVDGSTGVVTPVAAGSATITATIAANGDYCAGTATAPFTITSGGDTKTYTLISDLSTVDVTTEIVIARTSGTTYALSNDNGTSSAPSAVSVTISGNTLTTAATNVQWNIDYDTDNNTFVVYKADDNTKWLYCTNTNNGVRVGTNANKDFSITDDYIYNPSTSRYVGIYNDEDWRCYTSRGTNIQDQTFAFYGRALGTQYTVTANIPTGNGTVSLSSAKITESTGKVTITCVPDEGYGLDGTPTASNGTLTSIGINAAGYAQYELSGVTEDVTITIRYKKFWGVTVTTDNHGSATLDKRYVDTNGSVTLTLTPNNGYGEPITVTKTSGTATIGSVSAGSCTISNITSDVALSVSFTKLPTYTVTFNAGTGTIGANSTTTRTETLRGSGVTTPIATPSPECAEEWVFAYWSKTNQTSETTTAPTKAVNGNDNYVPANNNETLYAVYKRAGESGVETTVNDELNNSTIGISGTSYTDWNDKSATSDAKYAGNTAGGNTAIQMRSNNSNSGIVSTTSGGIIKSVSIDWNENTSSERIVDIYGYNSAYTAASDLYSASTRGSLLGSLNYSTSTVSLNNIPDDDGEYAYVGIRSRSGALYLNTITITWIASSTATTYYWTSPTCTACNESTHSFAEASVVLTYPHVGTYTNTFTTNNTGACEYKSSNKSVATVNATTGEVTIAGIGEAIISVHQGKTGDKCAVNDSYTINVKESTVQVVEVTTNDEIIIEHDFGGSTNALIDELITHEEGNIAEEVFFSKYFEASGSVKLLAIYNGTGKAVDPTKLRIRIVNQDASSQHIVNLADHVTADGMPNGKELIFYSWNKTNQTDKDIMDCVNDNNIDKSSWIAIPWSVYSTTSSTITFGGDEAIVLEQKNGENWDILDIIGCLTSDGLYADQTNTGQTSWMDHKGWYTNNGNQLNVSPETNDYGIGTVRCLLVRKFDVLSGKDARNKTTGNWGTGNFNTLAAEWYGKEVGKATGEYKNSCAAFSEVGSFDYYSSYQKYEEVSSSAYTATSNGDGTMTIKITADGGLASMACNFLKIKVTNADKSEVLSELEYRVPIIVSAPNTETNNTIFTKFGSEPDACAICDVAILENASLKPHDSGKNQLHDIEVYRNAKLEVPSGKEMSIHDLILHSNGDVNPQADIQGVLNRFDTKLYFDKRIDGNRWYWMTLPYDCDIADVVLLDGSKPTYGEGKDWVLKTYDGQQRANTQAAGCWKVFNDAKIQKGVGYILGVTPKAGHNYVELRFPMTAEAWDKDPARASIAVPVMATKSNGITPNHVGWNLIGNPYLTNYKPGYIGIEHDNNSNNLIPLGMLQKDGSSYKRVEGSVRYVVIPQDGGYSEYSQVAIGDQAIPAFMSYFVQIAGTADTEYAVDFKYANSRNAMPARRAPEEFTEAEDNHPIWYGIEMVAPNGEKDNTTLLISDDFTDEYDMMNDLVKMRGSYYQYYNLPVLATRNSTEELAFNALPDNSAEVIGVPVNYYAAQAGEYTISTDGRYDLSEVKEAKLFDATTNQYYDLLTDNYTFTANKGNNTDRFRLFVTVERNKVPTATENPTLADVAITTFDKTLVLSGLNDAADIFVYDMSGKLIRSDQASGGGEIWRTVVPATGVYFVRVNTANGQQTLRAIVK